MKFKFAKAELRRLYREQGYSAGFGPDAVRAFRKAVQIVRHARDERDFYALKSLHLEKLRGDRSGQRSMRLSRQWRLILEIREEGGGNVIVIVAIEDYH